MINAYRYLAFLRASAVADGKIFLHWRVNPFFQILTSLLSLEGNRPYQMQLRIGHWSQAKMRMLFLLTAIVALLGLCAASIPERRNRNPQDQSLAPRQAPEPQTPTPSWPERVKSCTTISTNPQNENRMNCVFGVCSTARMLQLILLQGERLSLAE